MPSRSPAAKWNAARLRLACHRTIPVATGLLGADMHYVLIAFVAVVVAKGRPRPPLFVVPAYRCRTAISFDGCCPNSLAAFLNSLTFVRLDLTKQRLFGSDLIDGPSQLLFCRIYPSARCFAS